MGVGLAICQYDLRSITPCPAGFCKVESAQYDPQSPLNTVLHGEMCVGVFKISLFDVGNHDDTGSIVTISREFDRTQPVRSQTDTAGQRRGYEQRKTGLKEIDKIETGESERGEEQRKREEREDEREEG
jgi:hypothetical protein